MKPIVVVDLDGTLANVDHRLNLVKREKKWFDKFYELAYKDKPNLWCVRLIQAMVMAGCEVRIVSARPVRLFIQTGEWLIRHGIPTQQVSLSLLRGDKDFTPDVELKRKWLHRSDVKKENILFVVDDRQRVVDMWREEGLVCLQCYHWEEFDGAKKELDAKANGGRATAGDSKRNGVANKAKSPKRVEQEAS